MKRFAIVLGLVVASWGAAVALAMCASVALAQAPVPEAVQKEALEGLKQGGFEGMFWVAAIVATVSVLTNGWLVKKFVDHLQATAAVALEQAKADLRTGDRLTSMENFLRSKGMP